MFKNIFLIEFKKNIKSPAFYIFTIIMFGITLAFTLVTDPNTYVIGINHGKEFHNAPIIIAQMLTRLSVFGLLFTMIIIGRSVAKDFEANIHEFIFTRPVSKFQYLFGRFSGSFLANILIFSGIILGFEIGIDMIDIKHSGSFRIGAYIIPIFLTLSIIISIL